MGSQSDGDSPGSTKDPTPSQDAPAQDAPVADTESLEANAAPASSSAKNLTLDEGKARAQAAKAASPKRANEGAAAAKKRAAPDSPSRESGFLKCYLGLFDSSDENHSLSMTLRPLEDLFWIWVSLKDFTVQELKELLEDRLLSYVLEQRDLRIEFAHLIAKRQLHSVMEGLRQQSKSSAQDECGYGFVNPGTVHRKVAKMPRTTYAPAVDPRSQQPSGSQPGAGLPAPTSSVTRGIPATSQAAGASQSAAAPGRPAPHGSGARRSGQGGQEELSHAFEYEAPSQPYPSGPSSSGRDSVGSLLSDEVRQLRDRVYANEIALGLGPGGQAASQAGKHEVHGRMPSYETQGYSYHSLMGIVRTRALSIRCRHTLRMTRVDISLVISLVSRRCTLTLAFLRPKRRTQRIVIPLKTPHVERRVRRLLLWEVNGVRRAMPGQDRKGSDEAVLQFVALYRANHL
ncbi:ABC Superfamily [Phytophthora palmivora]|uniref:ABC Superfamily n=1 Tax=Phytophthora palmivora TaxID=4796 RepID=A0A2P4XVT8_9STRA|nr:ABC Superfamily [Phytophthora palmivora]